MLQKKVATPGKSQKVGSACLIILEITDSIFLSQTKKLLGPVVLRSTYWETRDGGVRGPGKGETGERRGGRRKRKGSLEASKARSRTGHQQTKYSSRLVRALLAFPSFPSSRLSFSSPVSAVLVAITTATEFELSRDQQAHCRCRVPSSLKRTKV